MSDGKVIIDTSLNNKGFIKGINRMSAQTNGLTASVKKLGTAIASAFAVRSLISFGKECIELGSNIAEVQNVVDVAFGDMAYKIEEFADTSIQKFGMSRLAAKKTASTYMAMAKGMGIADEAASDMAISLAGLSGDVASFFNISQELADIKLKSVFTGETETLKDLGVVMTQANLKAFALEQGITKDIAAMTQAELVSLRYNFVLKQLALANGDFARTSDSWANQTRILSMQWQEFMSIVGQSLITVLTPLVKTLNAVVSSLISVANTINSVVSGLFGGANTQIQQTQANAAAVGGAIESSVEDQEALTDATKETAKAQQKMLAGFDEINKLSGDSSGSAESGSGAGTTIAAPTVTMEDTTAEAGNERLLAFFEDLRNAVQPVTDALGRLWDALKLVGSFAGDALRDFYETFLKPVGAWVMGEGLPRFIDAATNGLGAVNWKRINDALHTLWEALAPFAINVGEGLLWFWENVLVPLRTWAMNEVVPMFLEILADVIEITNEVIEAAKPAFLWLWETFLKPLAEYTGGIVVTLLEDFYGWLEVIAGLLTGDFDRAVGGAEQIVKAFGDRFNYVKEIALLAWDAVKRVFSGVSGWFCRVVIDPVTEGFKNFINGLIGMVEGFVNFFIRGINGIINGLNEIKVNIPEGVPLIGGTKFGISIPSVSELKLPRLATGAVIPPNREFMAVLGDQSRGNNIEAPENLIRQIVREESGGGNAQMLSVLQAILQAIEEGQVMEVEGQRFAKIVHRLNSSEGSRVGVRLVNT